MKNDPMDELLTRGVDTIYPSRELLEKLLRSGKKLRLYQGFDPTGTQLHIGHTVALMKLRQFQDLGHEVIFLIGDFTAMIGDPTGKIEGARKMLTKEQVRQNALNYKDQAGKILRFEGENKVKILYNSEWLESMPALEFLQMSHLLTFQQIIKRDMFQKRMEDGKDVMMNEFLYPVLQGYDSVAMDVDLEIGGTDQMFNMLVGRDLMKRMKNKEKFVVTVPLLTDSEGKKIGKTEGNVIGITDEPNDLYGKIMTLPDDVIGKCFELITPLSMEEVKAIQKELTDPSTNPMVYKKKLAHTLVEFYNNTEAANGAQAHFEHTFQKRELPRDIPEFIIDEKTIPIIDSLSEIGLTESKSEARRLVSQGAIDVDGQTIRDHNFLVQYKDDMIIKAGKRRFKRIKLK